jgi:mono/diheme cytochrome c family protein
MAATQNNVDKDEDGVMGKSGALFGYALKLTGACVPLACLALAAGPAYGQAAAQKDVKALNSVIKTNCISCHNTEDWAGSLSMDTLDLGHAGQDPEVWEKAITKLRGRLMPPAGKKQPSQADVDALVAYLETSLDAVAKSHPVGHVPIQRLNRTEYAASLKDLLGVDIDTKQALPTEVEVEGFSNIASALGMSPAFMEQYMAVARKAVKLAIGEPVPKMAKVSITATPAPATAFPLGTRGVAGGRGVGMSFTHVFPADGEYHFDIAEEDFVDMGLYPRGAEHPATMVILLDGVEVVRKEIGGKEYLDIADRDGPAGKKVLLARMSSAVPVTAGRHNVTITFIERARSFSNDPTGNGRMFQPILQTGIEIQGPYAPKGRSMNDARARIFVCMPKSTADERPCAETIARHMATKAYRRPATDADLKPLMKFYEEGRAEAGGFEAGVTEMVTAIMSSPDFLYRDFPTAAKAGESRLLTDLELGTRLSFFLWNTGPDDRLIELAAAKRLSDPSVMQAEIARMLKDPRANTLVENFALAWLNLDELEKVEPDGFSAAMRTNFETEIRMFLASVLLEDRSVVDLLNADWTFVNDSLAQQYGIQGVRGSTFRRVTLTNENRWGLLGKGAMLLRTSYGSRTSPVLRGAWVLDRIMGTPPAPPPPNVNTDIGVKDGAMPTTVRARLEEHRQNATCKACHGLIDPPGLALENFDNQGRWREIDVQAQRSPIDASTELSSGIKINGPVELRKYLASHTDQFPTTVTKRLMMYALNREVEYFDMPQVRQIVRSAAAGNYRFSALINGIVNSDAFRRQGPEEHKATVASSVTSGAAAARP